MISHAMILAAGRGERMRPLTDHTPKPLLDVVDKPLIIWHIERLATAGIKNIVINHAYLGGQIESRLADGAEWGVSISYSAEGEGQALETGGGILKALPQLGKAPFLVINGDVWCDVDFTHLSLQKDDLAHLVMVDNPEHNLQGDFSLAQDRVSIKGENCLTFSGVGLYDQALFSDSKAGVFPLAPLLRQAMNNAKVSGQHHQGDWIDVGTPQRLQTLNQLLINKPL